mmetsp:Transcript_26227/g.43692  ORF Transcript_26227/g.43692 Transcript_26227/m.43692 type:complete len:178 (+) Transcript_26227:271-804(+)
MQERGRTKKRQDRRRDKKKKRRRKKHLSDLILKQTSDATINPAALICLNPSERIRFVNGVEFMGFQLITSLGYSSLKRVQLTRNMATFPASDAEAQTEMLTTITRLSAHLVASCELSQKTPILNAQGLPVSYSLVRQKRRVSDTYLPFLESLSSLPVHVFRPVPTNPVPVENLDSFD